MTHYIVLKRFANPLVDSPADGTWEIRGHVEASGPEVARKKVDEGAGEYLVVPYRNATFITGTIETPEPRVISSEVSPAHYLDVQETLPDGDSDVSINEGSVLAGGEA